MTIHFNCLSCNAKVRAADKSAGKAARCPKCRVRIYVPVEKSWWENPPQSPPPASEADKLSTEPKSNAVPHIPDNLTEWQVIPEVEAVIEPAQAVPPISVAEPLPVESLPLARGWVYILLNSAMPDLVKIGFTCGSTKDRARQISAETGVPLPYSVAYDDELVYYEEAEAEIHKRLAKFRVNRQREHFCIPLKEAIRVMQEVVADYRKREVIEVAPVPATSPQMLTTAKVTIRGDAKIIIHGDAKVTPCGGVSLSLIIGEGSEARVKEFIVPPENLPPGGANAVMNSKEPFDPGLGYFGEKIDVWVFRGKVVSVESPTRLSLEEKRLEVMHSVLAIADSPIAIVRPPVTTPCVEPVRRQEVFEDDYCPRRHKPDFTSWHILHCAITLMTCGLWVPVWLIHWTNWQSAR